MKKETILDINNLGATPARPNKAAKEREFLKE
jgi:hypothetical protein